VHATTIVIGQFHTNIIIIIIIEKMPTITFVFDDESDIGDS